MLLFEIAIPPWTRKCKLSFSECIWRTLCDPEEILAIFGDFAAVSCKQKSK